MSIMRWVFYTMKHIQGDPDLLEMDPRTRAQVVGGLWNMGVRPTPRIDGSFTLEHESVGFLLLSPWAVWETDWLIRTHPLRIAR
jgi:hypothetical protein